MQRSDFTMVSSLTGNRVAFSFIAGDGYNKEAVSSFSSTSKSACICSEFKKYKHSAFCTQVFSSRDAAVDYYKQIGYNL
jgi:hypothetical protein